MGYTGPSLRSLVVCLAVYGMSSSNAATAPPAIPQMLTSGVFPSPDETIMINGSYLTDPLITNGLAYVESVVPASLLNVPPSKYILYGTVTYTADPVANCYWQPNQCVRTTNGTWGLPDIISCPNNYDWGLTYDDAPADTSATNGTHYNDTTTLLALLDKLNIKATFFVTGSQATYFTPTLLKMVNDSQHIAHHTWTHHPLTSLTNVQIVAEMLYTSAKIYSATGLAPYYFRPPYGDIDDRVRAIVNALGYRTVMWGQGYDSKDSDVTPNATYYQGVLNTVDGWFNTQPGFISLQHTLTTFANGIAEDALSQIIAMGGVKNQIQAVPQCLGTTQWYNVTTKFNTCTIPGGCGNTPTTSTGPASVGSNRAFTAKWSSSLIGVALLFSIMLF